MSSILEHTLLNVDDTEAARYATNRTLTHAGFNVIDAATGADALEKVESMGPSLVLLDVHLPDMSGIDVCRTIKQRWPNVVVLQTSATYVSASDRTKGLEGGADAYLVQPIDPEELVASVRALLRMRAAEESTRQLNETLERRIAERTRELNQANIRLLEQIAQRERAEAALVHSQKMEAVGQLTGAMAHDFNNILASMTGYIHLVRRKTTDAGIRDMMEKALNAAERGKRLTLRLLAFTRRGDLLTAPVDVHSLVTGMLEWLKQTCGSSITLELMARGGDLIAVTDAGQLELAVLNLVINARDAMPEGGRIEIELAPFTLEQADEDLAPGRYVKLTVTDSGQGMPPDVVEHAFEPFFTTKPVGRGTGLGLAQVADVARLSRGAARMSSAVGTGTSVSLWLAAGDSLAMVPDPFKPAPANLVGHGERIVLIDDEPDIRRTLSQMLLDNGYQTATAANGAEGLGVIRQFDPQLLLLDFALPGMSGIELAKRLRTTHPDLPIVFLSGHAQRDILEVAVPGVRLLRKPFKSEDLFVEVRRALGPSPIIPTHA